MLGRVPERSLEGLWFLGHCQEPQVLNRNCSQLPRSENLEEPGVVCMLADLCEFGASLVYIVSTRTARARSETLPVSKNKKRKPRGWGGGRAGGGRPAAGLQQRPAPLTKSPHFTPMNSAATPDSPQLFSDLHRHTMASPACTKMCAHITYTQ